ncbi:MAG: hypothetical protein P8171_25905 [Candidatus Thiodiazotropha sp.]
MARNSTKYKPLKLNPVIDFENSRPLHNADLLLRDAHAMLFLPRKDIAALESGCNYAMLITLCSILGGVSRTLYPRNVPNKDTDKECFLKLFERMPWGNEQHGWIPRETAAGLLYDGFRSPLVHELGTDEGEKKNKKQLPHDKYVVGKRGDIPVNLSLTNVINCESWNDNWPVMHFKDKDHKKVKISLVGLYYHTRKLIELLTYDDDLIKNNILPAHTNGE